MIRHAARSHEEPHAQEFFGVSKGYATPQGKIEAKRIGLQRRNEYVHEKKLLKEEYDPRQILSLSTFKPRCAVSGDFFLQGLYPLHEIQFD